MNVSATEVRSQQAPVEDCSYDLFRADTYGLLGSLLSCPPSVELLEWLAGVEVDQQSGSPMSPAWEMLKQAASAADAGAVADEYQQLFIGLGKGEVVPYASWYKTGFLMERPLAELRQDLRQLGLEADEQTKEPEDHIAALCQVMALLVHPAQDFQPEQQSQFFERHLKDWYRRFFDDLQDSASADFYRSVSRFGGIFLDLEALQLEA